MYWYFWSIQIQCCFMNNRFFSKCCTDKSLNKQKKKVEKVVFWGFLKMKMLLPLCLCFLFALYLSNFSLTTKHSFMYITQFGSQKYDWWHLLSLKCLSVLSDFWLSVSLQWEGKRTQPSVTFSSKVYRIRKIRSCSSNCTIFSASSIWFLGLFECTL